MTSMRAVRLCRTLLAVGVVVSLAACGGDSSEDTTDRPPSPVTDGVDTPDSVEPGTSTPLVPETTSAPDTIPAPDTTIAPETTVAPDTTVAPVPFSYSNCRSLFLLEEAASSIFSGDDIAAAHDFLAAAGPPDGFEIVWQDILDATDEESRDSPNLVMDIGTDLAEVMDATIGASNTRPCDPTGLDADFGCRQIADCADRLITSPQERDAATFSLSDFFARRLADGEELLVSNCGSDEDGLFFCELGNRTSENTSTTRRYNVGETTDGRYFLITDF